MKKIFFNILTLSIILLGACNNSGKKAGENNSGKMDKDTNQLSTTNDDKNIKTVAVTYTNVDASAAASIKEILDHYLHIKNALSNDNSREAAFGAKSMEKAIGTFDKSLLTAEQKQVYDEIEEELKEHAEHIGKNGGDIKHQRSHFSMLSEDIYDLIKAFGGGRTLYHDYCPMYNENKGAMWLSETREIKNPYFGAEMLKCGSVEGVIK